MGIGAAGLALGSTYYVNRPEFGRLPTGMRRERILASPHYYDGQFQNLEPIDQTVKGGEAKAMAEFLFGSSEGLKPKGRMISQKTDLHSLPLDEDCVVWMGHSSLYLHLGGYRILVDPVFSSYASPAFSSTGPSTAAISMQLPTFLLWTCWFFPTTIGIISIIPASWH